MVKLICPLCSSTVEIPDDALDGELFEHDACGAQVEVYVEEGKKKLRLAEGISEDWGE
ncbi:MAG: sulfonate ABC transporter [Aigarchaeota archaeon]|nr:sulfonate ABC transporter [Aigarchaeota archaeon]MDW8093315.1 sulfonate ABC transporter [Nitrososphaerota archaeon]